MHSAAAHQGVPKEVRSTKQQTTEPPPPPPTGSGASSAGHSLAQAGIAATINLHGRPAEPIAGRSSREGADLPAVVTGWSLCKEGRACRSEKE